MAISVPIPKDLGKVKTKLIGNFTKRQVICFGLALLAGLPLYFLIRKPLGTEAALIIMMAVMMPFFVCALYEKNGIPAEKYLLMVIRFKLSKPIRPYRAVNLFSQLEDREKKRREVKYLEAKRKQHRETHRRSSEAPNRAAVWGDEKTAGAKKRAPAGQKAKKA